MTRTSRLPWCVPHRHGATKYDASNEDDLLSLASEIRQLNSVERCVLAATLVEHRVMFPPLTMRLGIWVARVRGVSEQDYLVRCFTHPVHGEAWTDNFIRETVGWALRGEDEETENSAGGFSQREVNFIAGMLSILKEKRALKVAA